MLRPRFALVAANAALVLAATAPAHADGVLPANATPVQREQAQSRFLRGKDLMAVKQLDQALAEFRASHEIVASPNTRLEIARCLRAMGRTVAAFAELGRTSVEAKELIAQDNRYRRAYDAATAERAEIQPQLGFVSLTLQNGTDETKVSVGGEEIRRAAWTEPAPVLAGSIEVVVESPGHAPIRRTVTLAAGQSTALTIDAQSADPQPAAPVVLADTAAAPASTSGPSPLRTWAYVAGGVGVVGLATFAVFGTMARSTYDDLNTACSGGACPPGKADEISSGKAKQTVANVGLVVGVAGVAAGVTLFVLSQPRSAPAASAALVLGPGWTGLRGAW